jgi:KUP system potassium uptake protein
VLEPRTGRFAVRPGGPHPGFYRVRAHYGFMEWPDVHAEDTTWYVDRLRLLPTGPAPMTRWRKRLFGFMANNAASVTDFFNVPTDHVVELGARVEF